MEKSVEKSIQELIAKAKRDGITGKSSSSRSYSSFHSLMKTREQAEHFWLLLKYEEDKARAKEDKLKAEENKQ